MKHVLITGSTGIIGSALVPLFLNNPDIHLYLPIRSKKNETLEARFDTLWQFWKEDITLTNAQLRITILDGNNLNQPSLGLSLAQYTLLVQNLTNIVHCAGSINLGMPDDIARQNTYALTEQILALATHCSEHHTFHKLDYVSTVGVAGKYVSPVPETTLLDVIDFQNNYEKYKAEAERLLFQCTYPFPITVHRPSMVVGNSKTGKIIHFKGVYYLMRFFSGEFTCGVIPNVSTLKMDMVPVDYVAGAIHWSSLHNPQHGQILHLCAGEAHCVSLKTLIPIIKHVKATLHLKQFMLLPIPSFLFWKLLTVIRWCTVNPYVKKSLSALGVFATYFNHPQHFAVKNTRTILEKAGITYSPPDTFLEAIIRYYYTHDTRFIKESSSKTR